MLHIFCENNKIKPITKLSKHKVDEEEEEGDLLDSSLLEEDNEEEGKKNIKVSEVTDGLMLDIGTKIIDPLSTVIVIDFDKNGFTSVSSKRKRGFTCSMFKDKINCEILGTKCLWKLLKKDNDLEAGKCIKDPTTSPPS